MGVASYDNLEAIYSSLPLGAPLFAVSIRRLLLCLILPVAKNGDYVNMELTPMNGPSTLSWLFRQGRDKFAGLISQLRAFKLEGKDILPSSYVYQVWGHSAANLSWLTSQIPGPSIDCCLWVL